MPAPRELKTLLWFASERPPAVPNDVDVAEVMVRRDPEVGQVWRQVDNVSEDTPVGTNPRGSGSPTSFIRPTYR